MNAASSSYAVTRFWVTCLRVNSARQGVPPFAIPYFTDCLSDLLTEAREAAELEEFVTSLESDPEIVALMEEEP